MIEELKPKSKKQFLDDAKPELKNIFQLIHQLEMARKTSISFREWDKAESLKNRISFFEEKREKIRDQMREYLDGE